MDTKRFGEVRLDYRTGKYVVFSEARTNRPVDYIKKSEISDSGPEKCPFEPGKEPLNKTVLTIGDPWRVRAITNKYPFFTTEAGIYSNSSGMLKSKSNYGHSYVIIDTPKHSLKFEDFNSDEINDLSEALSTMETMAYKDKKVRFVWINKDYGPMSSGTLSHSHWQVFGFPMVPMEIKNRLIIANRFEKKTGKCLMEETMQIEKPRIIIETKHVLGYAPFGSLYTGESIVMPKRHSSNFSMLDNNERNELLRSCANIVKANNAIFGIHSYNILFYGLRNGSGLHLYAEIIPRLHAIGPMQMAGIYGGNIFPENYANMARAKFPVM